MSNLIIYSDGGSRGNPGPAAYGFIIINNGQTIGEGKKCLGETTNNVAEYEGIKAALNYVLDQKLKAQNITCFLDSELIVKQLKGEYKIKKIHLAQQAMVIHKLIQTLKTQDCQQVSFHHVPRDQNNQADGLVNQALDAQALT